MAHKLSWTTSPKPLLPCQLQSSCMPLCNESSRHRKKDEIKMPALCIVTGTRETKQFAPAKIAASTEKDVYKHWYRKKKNSLSTYQRQMILYSLVSLYVPTSWIGKFSIRGLLPSCFGNYLVFIDPQSWSYKLAWLNLGFFFIDFIFFFLGGGICIWSVDWQRMALDMVD